MSNRKPDTKVRIDVDLEDYYIKADKAKSTEKIDGTIVMIMALDRAIRCGNEKEESVYDSRGILVL